jgi:quinol monooxygenase YgiN
VSLSPDLETTQTGAAGADPIVVTAVFTPKPGAFDRVVEGLSRAIAEVHKEPGCLLYAIHRDPDDRIVMIEKWESVELLDAHGSGTAVQGLGASIEGLLTEPAVVTRLVPIPAGTEAQGLL